MSTTLITKIFNSVLSESKYALANPADWLIGSWWELDPVFAGRVAYYCSKVKKKLVLTETFRTMETQKIYYEEYLQWRNHKILGKHRIKMAAYPGTSWHGIRVALDGSRTDGGKTHPIYFASNAALAKYGICKPLDSKGEHWHVQPIETAALGSKCNNKYTPVDMAPSMRSQLALGDATIDFLARYEYGFILAEKLLAGHREFSKGTIDYLKTYKYWDDLQRKLGITQAAS